MRFLLLALLSVLLIPDLIVAAVFTWTWFERWRLKRKGVCLRCYGIGDSPLYELRQEKHRRLREKSKIDPKSGIAYDVYETDGVISTDVREIKCEACGRSIWKREWN